MTIHKSLLVVSTLAALYALCVVVKVDLYNVYAHPRVYFKSWFKQWRSLPFDATIFQGVKECPEERSFPWSRPCNIAQIRPSSLDLNEYQDLVPCDGIEGIGYALCAWSRSRDTRSQLRQLTGSKLGKLTVGQTLQSPHSAYSIFSGPTLPNVSTEPFVLDRT